MSAVARDPDVTAIVLAGGEGRRMGGVDKGLLEFAGRPLVEHVLARIAPQVGAVILSANRNGEVYARYGFPVVADRRAGFNGPLAGIEAALAAVGTPWALVVPCDLPALPADLNARLAAARAPAVAVAGGRRHAVLRLPSDSAGRIAALLDAGERRVSALCSALDAVEVGFDDAADGFVNLNTPAELTRRA